MTGTKRQRTSSALSLALALTLTCHAVDAQQSAPATAGQPAPSGPVVVKIGSFNVPYQVLDEHDQWTTLLSVVSNPDLELLISDVSNAVWLQTNAETYLDRGHYILTVVSFYKTRRVCRADQIATGLEDGAYIDACNVLRYRVRRVAMDTQQSTVTLLFAAMVRSDGTVDSDSIRRETRTRGIAELDNESRAAILKATAIIAKQAKAYDLRLHGAP